MPESSMEEYTVSEVICLHCLKRWIAVRPRYTRLGDLVCPGCGLPGAAIETGQEHAPVASREAEKPPIQ
jgi:hypothetical protein